MRLATRCKSTFLTLAFLMLHMAFFSIMQKSKIQLHVLDNQWQVLCMKDDQVYFKKRCKLCSSVATSSFSCYLRLFNFLLLITTKNISFLFNYCLRWIDHWVCTVSSKRKVKSLLLTDIIRFLILMLLVLILHHIFLIRFKMYKNICVYCEIWLSYFVI